MEKGEKQIRRHKEAGKNAFMRVESGKEKLLITREEGNKLGGLKRQKIENEVEKEKKTWPIANKNNAGGENQKERY